MDKKEKMILINPPFCNPAGPSYSISYLYSFIKKNLDLETEILDLNLEFHIFKFKEFGKMFKTEKMDNAQYNKIATEFRQVSEKTFTENNKKVVQDKQPEYFNELLHSIKNKNPSIVAFSLIYNSQLFYTYTLINELKKSGIKTIVGGPAVNAKLYNCADKFLKDECELLEYLGKKDKIIPAIPDFSLNYLNEYFTPKPVIPIKSSSSCPYKLCTFCTHHGQKPYHEQPLENLRELIISSKAKHFNLIDDMVTKNRLMKIAEIFEPLKISWMCQLKPTNDFDLGSLQKLRKAGLKVIYWGIESACDRILELMKKGTKKEDIKHVLKNSHNAGIKNGVYIMFGFPTETRNEFEETIGFLKENSENIDIISTSVFGLQQGSKIYNNPSEFGITKIKTQERTILDPKITYETKSGLSHEEVFVLRKRKLKAIEKINKYPKMMNFFREHLLCNIE